jgi:glutamate-5-semialdehyde dehydrogenase
MATTPIDVLGARALGAKAAVGRATTAQKDEALTIAADLLIARRAEVLGANSDDVAAATERGESATVVDRLRLDESKIEAMAGGLRQVAALADPVGEVIGGWVRPNGLRISQVRVPLGVVGIIYENRPNVTSDAFALCLKSGNVAFLRGSSGAIRSNLAIASVLRDALVKAGLHADALVMVDDTSRESAVAFMRQRGVIDCLIPRGGASLIASILENATVPYIIDGDGNCHLYVDESADLDVAESILVNGKTQRPSVCNALESLVVHTAASSSFLARVDAAIPGVELVGDERACAAIARCEPAADGDFAREFLDLKLSIRVVDTLDEAIDHVNETGSGHSEAIVTTDLRTADRFVEEVDAAAVVVNASTRFVDGEEFGFGAEIGISTQKLHARGPMGLRELTTAKYVVRGDGQIRG